MACREQDELIASVGKKHIARHKEPTNALFDDDRERRMKLAIRAYVEDAYLLCDLVSGGR
jgi:hypothetical protein